MFVDKSISTSEMPADMVEHIKAVRDYLRKDLGDTNCAVSISGRVSAVIYI